MVVIVLVFCVFLVFGGYKYTWKQLWEIFKQTTILTFLFTIVGVFVMMGIHAIKEWFKDDD